MAMVVGCFFKYCIFNLFNLGGRDAVAEVRGVKAHMDRGKKNISFIPS